MLRSTYEFIYALYLLHSGVEFEMENVRVPAVRKNNYAETFICDFNIGDTIVEVKGIPSGKDCCIRESFESAGYKFKELFHEDIELLKKELSIYYNIDEMLKKINEGHSKREYFVYTYTCQCVGSSPTTSTTIIRVEQKSQVMLA